MATRREIFQQLRSVAAELYGAAEGGIIAEMIILAKGHISRNQLLVEPNVELQISDLDSIIEQLRSWRPVQYIVGHALFDDIELEVGEGVLIPRPETEELVEWIASNAEATAKIVDVCTGSGCIAIALRRRVADSRVVALDISHDALAIARRNAERYAPDLQIVEGDALSNFSCITDTKVDIIVSNPPYIPLSDRATMRRNVTDYEPSLALFVEDSDPLLFYRSIARTARKMLKSGGRLYFEIYENFGSQIEDMLRAEGYCDIVVREDFRGKQRMICATMN